MSDEQKDPMQEQLEQYRDKLEGNTVGVMLQLMNQDNGMAMPFYDFGTCKSVDIITRNEQRRFVCHITDLHGYVNEHGKPEAVLSPAYVLPNYWGLGFYQPVGFN